MFQKLLSLLQWLNPNWMRSHSQLLLSDGRADQLVYNVIHPDEIAQVWQMMLSPNQFKAGIDDHAVAVSAAVAQQRLRDIARKLQHNGEEVRELYFASADQSAAVCKQFVHPIGLIKLHNLSDQAAREIYAPIQAIRRNPPWQWLAVLLSDWREEPIAVAPKTSIVPKRIAVADPASLLDNLLATTPKPVAQPVSVPRQPQYPVPIQMEAPQRATLDTIAPIVEERPTEREERITRPIVVSEPVVEAVAPPAPKPQPIARPQPTPRPTVVVVEDEQDDEPEAMDWLDDALDVQDDTPTLRLSEITRVPSFAIIGPKGSGKTTLLLTIVDYLTKNGGQTIVLDPHGSPSKWGAARSVGAGRDYDVIRRVLGATMSEMDKRFKKLGAGQRDEEYWKPLKRHILLASDETRSIVNTILDTPDIKKGGEIIEKGEPGAGKTLASILTEGRKVGMGIGIAAHNDTLEALGFPKGAADLKRSFDFIIYLGGVAFDRCPDPELRAKLETMKRPAAILENEFDRWFVLDFDLAPVFPPKLATVEDEDDDTIIDQIAAAPPKPQAPAGPKQWTDKQIRETAVQLAAKIGKQLPLDKADLADQRVAIIAKTLAKHGAPVVQIADVLFAGVGGGRFRGDISRVINA